MSTKKILVVVDIARVKLSQDAIEVDKTDLTGANFVG